MSAKDNLNEDLFHGTGGGIKGGVVKPGKNHFYGYGAYGTTNLSQASGWAAERAHEEGRLFGAVYRVRPAGKNSKVEEITSDEDYVIDPEGLTVVEPVGFPINRKAL